MPYIYYNPNPARKDTIDCTVRAISKLMDMDWDTTYLKLSVQGMMNNGTMSQQQFEQCRQMANMLTGKNY